MAATGHKDDLRSRLNELFAQRDELLGLYQERRVAVHRADIHSRRAIEAAIADLITEPLELHRRNLPGFNLVAEAATTLLETQDWNLVHPAGSSAEHWPDSLKSRLMRLAGDVEPVIRQLLNEEDRRAVA
jgi:hypothetical protein